jgi:DNA-binding NarL/FixJ family response regulator
MPSIAVAGTSGLDEQGAARIRECQPDVLLVDALALARGDFVPRLTVHLPSMLIIACGVREEAEEVIACAQRGAAGYVGRDASAEDLVRIVRSVARGELPCPPRVAAMLFREMGSPARIAAPLPSAVGSLTSREREVVTLIDRGLSNKEIAAALSIELTTVKNHVHHILEKLEVHGRSAAAARLRRSAAGSAAG